MLNRCRRVVIALLAITFIFGCIWLLPRILAIYHQVWGGQLLAQVIKPISDGNDVLFPCVLTLPAGDGARAKLMEAIDHLQTALKYNPKLAQADLMLGRSYFLLDDYQKAIGAYQAYTHLRPENPLGHLELGFAYRKGSVSLSGSDVSDAEMYSLILAELTAAGVDSDRMVKEANYAFWAQEYQVAACLFEMTASAGPSMLSSDEVLWDVAAILSEQSLPQHGRLTALPVYVLGDSAQINVEDMIWIRRGTMLGEPMSSFPSRKQDTGIFWWNGASTFVVQVARPGQFRLRLLAQNTPPAPTKLQIEHNFAPILDFELTREDMSWQEFETDLYLDAGLQLIAVRFTNNAIVNGVDRNAVVDWVELERK